MIELLKIRTDLIDQVGSPLPVVCLLPDNYSLEVATVRCFCGDCGDVKLRRQRTIEQHPVGISIGRPLLHKLIKKCPECGREYSDERFNEFVPPNDNYCYDVIVEVGLGRFRHNRQNREIQKDILDRYGLFLSRSTIGDLAHRFLDYLAAVHHWKTGSICQMLDEQGGYVAHMDGTCEAGTDILFTVIDEISGVVLSTDRMATENVDDLEKLFDKCRDSFGLPLTTMRDLSMNIAAARDKAFGDVPDLICQYHFLENVGKALFKETYQELTKRLRKLKIQAKLKSLRAGLVKRNKKALPISEKDIEKFLKAPQKCLYLDNSQLRKHLTYFVLRWLNDYFSELKGEYFPFDQSTLVFYRRCVKVYDLLDEVLKNSVSFKGREKQTLASIFRALEPVKTDEPLVDIALRLEKAVTLFEDLRGVLKFDRSDGKPILRHCPPSSSKKQVLQTEKRLERFSYKLQTTINGNDPYMAKCSKILINYLEKYQDKLVGHLLTLPEKSQTILLDRTNNISEHSFGNTKKGWRRKLGTKKLIRQLQSARHEEFLVANLENQNYLDAVYGGSIKNMLGNFAKCYKEALKIRKLRLTTEEKHTMPVRKKSLRQDGILLNVFHAIRGLYGCPELKN